MRYLIVVVILATGLALAAPCVEGAEAECCHEYCGFEGASRQSSHEALSAYNLGVSAHNTRRSARSCTASSPRAEWGRGIILLI